MENMLAIVAIVISVISGLFSAFSYIKTMERDRKQQRWMPITACRSRYLTS